MEYSGGTPRLINIVCDHCLLFGYVDQERRIGRPIVNRAIEYLEEGTLPQRKVWRLSSLKTRRLARWAVGTLAVALASTVVGLAMRPDTAVLLARSVRHLLVPSARFSKRSSAPSRSGPFAFRPRLAPQRARRIHPSPSRPPTRACDHCPSFRGAPPTGSRNIW